MVRVMSAELMFPNTPHTSTRSAGTWASYQRHSEASPSTVRTWSATPDDAARSRAKATSPGSSSTSSAETSARRGWVATTSMTSRPCPAHMLTIRIGPRRAEGTRSRKSRAIPCTSRSRSDNGESGFS